MGEEKELEVILQGKGNTKDAAFSDALTGLQKQISAETKRVILRIEPLAVDFLEGTEQRFTEKFLFFFLKREVSVFHIKVRVRVRLFLVDLDDCAFTSEQGKQSFFR